MLTQAFRPGLGCFAPTALGLLLCGQKRLHKYRGFFDKSTRSLTPTHALKKTRVSLTEFGMTR
jgi:hypothetical protein